MLILCLTLVTSNKSKGADVKEIMLKVHWCNNATAPSAMFRHMNKKTQQHPQYSSTNEVRGGFCG